MFDRRKEDWVQLEAHLLDAEFDDGQHVEVQVNPEFDLEEAHSQALRYLPVIGQLPRALRADVKTIWIHRGKHGFGGGNDNLLIHTDQGEDYISKGILAETFFHEAAHTSLDHRHARNKKWIQAQQRDAIFISKYAMENPQREDIAESFLLYFAFRFKSDRLDEQTKQIIGETMPNRISYFDDIAFHLHPAIGD